MTPAVSRCRRIAIAGMTVAAVAATVSPSSAASRHVGSGTAVMHVFSTGKGPAKNNRPGGGGRSPNLYYHGGVGGVGVETSGSKVYLVLWGSQWNSNDPSGEAAILQNFYAHVGGSRWLASVTQYCQGISSGSSTCTSSVPHADGSITYVDTWSDNTAAAPSRPSQSQLAAEAINAAAHWHNTTSGANSNGQYVIATATGNNASGFGTQYCAWHSSTSSSYGNIAYTNLPYMTDAGASCGANFNGLGPTAGITIVSGHELAETITDQFPNGGWLDSQGAENGDKCAWIQTGSTGASATVTLSGGVNYPVQSLWSNAKSGCTLS